jgi:ferrochelatase
VTSRIYNSRVTPPFDAVLFVAFGGPQGPADIRPFLANVLRGRRVAPERVEEVAHHYELFGGVSPITELTMAQAERLEAALAAAGMPLRVYVGMRNWHPYLRDTLAAMARDGVRRAVGVLAAAQRSYSSCTQYRENVAAARAALRADGVPDVQVTYVGDWHCSPGFVAANAGNVAAALTALPPAAQPAAELVFTAHSIPLEMARRYPYERQLMESCAAIAAELARQRAEAPRAWRLVYQSRSGRPEDPWLEPDIGDDLRAAAARGARSVVACPVGFICDHVEVLYDLDVEAAAIAREVGVEFRRAAAVNAHPAFIGALRDSVADTVARHARGIPLPIVAAAAPAR